MTLCVICADELPWIWLTNGSCCNVCCIKCLCVHSEVIDRRYEVMQRIKWREQDQRSKVVGEMLTTFIRIPPTHNSKNK